MAEHDPRFEEKIFSTALHCAPAERAHYLDEACAGRPELRQRIEELLKAQPQLGGFMETPADIGTPAVELWTINRGSHVPTFYSGTSSSAFAHRVID